MSKDLLALFLNSTGISIDTRTIQKGELFVAVEGAKFDGHNYIVKAFEKGASYVIGHKTLNSNIDNYIQVDNSIKALQNLATDYRQYLDLPIIAITGSNGKTTNKELLNQVLSAKFKTYCTAGNLNNHLGVPLSLLRITKNTEIAIIEMGANHQTEIAELCQIARPNFGYITNIGKAHLEGFGGIEGVKKGKKELYDYINQSSGIFFLNELESSLHYLLEEDTTRCIGLDQLIKDRALHYKTEDYHPFCIQFDDHDKLETSLYGEHQAKNVIAAIAIGLYFNISLDKIISQLQGFQTGSNRFSFSCSGNMEIYLDAYNANPTSMKASISTFAKLNGEFKIVILGEMFELGEYSESEHRALIDFCQSLESIHSIWCYGHAYESIRASDHMTYFKDFDLLKAAFDALDNKHYQILIKGSRGNKLERLLAQQTK